MALLPYLKDNQLYQQFKLDEPWDSDHNKKLILQMPTVYANSTGPKRPGETHYRVLVGDWAAFDWSKGLSLAHLTAADGASITLMAVEAADSVPWTKPDELLYDAKKPMPKFGNFHGDGTFCVVFCDGYARTLRHDMKEETLRALITWTGGEVVDPDI